ncbi:MAG: hypothetical protein M1828_003546 [Chrysothrix sp. TS-e1954]|nr:MAG: hypothetical protein M1828_003546 [Chrysothrix sp. TS-e1954]
MPDVVGLNIIEDEDKDILTALHSATREERPDASRRATEPNPSMLLQAHFQQRPRSRSPYARGHGRSHSAASALVAPPMARTKSLPLVHTASESSWSPSHSPVRPSSPLRGQTPSRSTSRRSFDESHPSSATPSFMDIESIAEDSELDLTPRNFSASRDAHHNSPMQASFSSTFPRFAPRRRPPSPLMQYSLPTVSAPLATAPARSASPQPLSTKFNEPFPSHASSNGSFNLSGSSSIPSTPTSLRSRSPSISSLETIPDSPDAEEAAVEAHNIARLEAAADAAEAAETDAETERKLQKAGFDVRGVRISSGLGLSPGSKDKRKRWSVCGAERRGDFEMETIWED